jgi:ribonuclease-3
MLVSDFSNLEKALGYKFNDKTLLLNALTHTSFANERYHKDSHLKSNERVEFVGDAVLGLVAGTHIYQNYPYMPEGKMSKLRAGVVCEASLAKLALQIGLDDYLRLGVGEEQSGGRTKPSLLADAFESDAIVLPVDFSQNRNTELTVTYYMPSEVGNEAENAEAIFDLRIVASNE